MNDNILDVDTAIMQINLFEEKDMHYSASVLWDKIIKIAPTAYRKIRYADTLRLCGYGAKAKMIFLAIDTNDISIENEYFYHLYLGQLYADMGDYKLAKEEFLKCTNFEKCDTVPYIFIANLLKPESDNAEAIYYLKMALDKEGDIDEVYYNLATRLAIKGDMSAALDAIKKCRAIDPGYPNSEILENDLNSYYLAKNILIM